MFLFINFKDRSLFKSIVNLCVVRGEMRVMLHFFPTSQLSEQVYSLQLF